MADAAALTRLRRTGTLGSVEEEQGIYREEVILMTGALTDIRFSVERIVSYLEGDDGEEETEEDPAPDA